VQKAVLEAMRALDPTIVELCGREALVSELACLIADPGAPQQELHSDTNHREGFLLTAFIALQDISCDMGATIVLPRSNTVAALAELEYGCGDFTDRAAQERHGLGMIADPGRGAVQFEAEAGDVLLIDSRVLHCGGANSSELRRRLLYVTLRPPGVEPSGSTDSILPEYAGRFCARDFREWCVDETAVADHWVSTESCAFQAGAAEAAASSSRSVR